MRHSPSIKKIFETPLILIGFVVGFLTQAVPFSIQGARASQGQNIPENNRLYSGPKAPSQSHPQAPSPSRSMGPSIPDPSREDFYQQYSRWMQNRVQRFESFFNDDRFFSDSEDLFQEMEAMRREMIQRMRENQSLLNSLPPARPNPHSGQGRFGEMFREEKGGKLYIHIAVPEGDEGKVKIETRKDHLILTRQTQGNQQGPYSFYTGTSLTQETIAIPPGTDPHSVQYRKEKNKIVVEIPRNP